MSCRKGNPSTSKTEPQRTALIAGCSVVACEPIGICGPDEDYTIEIGAKGKIIEAAPGWCVVRFGERTAILPADEAESSMVIARAA